MSAAVSQIKLVITLFLRSLFFILFFFLLLFVLFYFIFCNYTFFFILVLSPTRGVVTMTTPGVFLEITIPNQPNVLKMFHVFRSLFYIPCFPCCEDGFIITLLKIHTLTLNRQINLECFENISEKGKFWKKNIMETFLRYTIKRNERNNCYRRTKMETTSQFQTLDELVDVLTLFSLQQWENIKIDLNRLIISYLPNPSALAAYDTRSILKRGLTGLNSEFSFS